jgi:flavin reductase (DIM6/NTAB) family NADH-FMN oxidoreductase RutF
MNSIQAWRCTVCGYVHEGENPPDECPVCGAPATDFVPIVDTDDTAQRPGITSGPSAVSVVPVNADGSERDASLFSISYGLYVVSSRDGEKLNGQTNNTLFQITADPARIALGIHKANLTHDYLVRSGLAVVTVLGQDALDYVRHFGFQSGRSFDKFRHISYQLSPDLKCPVLPDQVAYMECVVVPDLMVSLNTHTMFVCDVVGGGLLQGGTPMTYSDYRRLKSNQ